MKRRIVAGAILVLILTSENVLRITSCKYVWDQLPGEIREWYADSDPVTNATVLNVRTLASITATTPFGPAPGYKCAAEVQLQRSTAGVLSKVTVTYTVFSLEAGYIFGIEDIQ
jgi:hypothetical protein